MKHKMLILLCAFILAEGFILAKSAHASLSVKQIHQMYHKMCAANKIKILPIYVKSGSPCNGSLACTNLHRITLSTELLSLVKNDDELAGVIGHEMAHAVHKSELKSDVLGLKYAQKAGYGYCVAAQFLKGYIEDAKHPSGAVRYKNSGCP